MASQSHLRSTYFSTPRPRWRTTPTRSGQVNCSTGDAPAPPNAWKSTSVITPLPVGFSVRTGQWRQIVTIEDALKGGCMFALMSANVKTAVQNCY